MLKLNRLSLLLSKLSLVLVISTLFLGVACKKDTGKLPVSSTVDTDTIKPKISFVFVNRLGYKGDTSSVKWLQAVAPYSVFYNPLTNKSNLVQTSYNRYQDIYPLSDSIEHFKYNNVVGAQYAYQLKLYWTYKDINHFRELTFRTKNWPNACDPIKVAKDTLIKFVYPDDTASSRFTKTVRWQ